jgi:transposase
MEDADGVKKNYLIAIEAQLSYSGGPRLEQKLANYPLKYQGIIYFAVPKVCRLFERLNLVKKYPKVAVQEIAEVSRSLQQPAWRVPGDPALGLRYSPKRLDSPLSEFDLAVLDLLADQGAVPMDQFFRFLGMDEAKEKDKEKVERLVSRLVHAHLVRRAKPLVDEPIWLWLTRTGGIMSRRNLSPRAPSLGNLEFARALNEARLQLTKDLSDDGWVSGRVLRHEHGVRGSLPHAVIQRGPKRIAIEVVLSAGAYGLQRKWKQRRQEYQEILWYYSRLARTPVKRFAAMTKSSRLQVSPLPNAGDMDFASRPKWSRRFYGINKELWYWLTRRPPVTVWPIPVEELPLEVPQVIGAAAKIAQTPQVIAGWRSLGTIWAVFCVETDVGTYRVAKSSHGWDAVELVDGSKPIDDLIFRKESISLSAALATAQEKQDTCKHYEVDDDLWVKVKPLMPPSYTSSRRASDRAVLSAVLFILRSNIGRSRLPQELGYGSGQSVISRWRKWQEHEGWEDVMRVLIEGLPDGAELDWSRLDRKGSPSKS